MKHISIITLALILSLTSHAQVNLEQVFSTKKHKIVCADYSPDSKFISTGGFDSKINVWDASSGTIVKTLSGLKDFPLSLAYSADGNYLISGGKDSKVSIWNMSMGILQIQMKGHKGDVTSVDISKDNIIASASKDKSIKVWNMSGTLLNTLYGHAAEVMSLEFSPDGTKLISGSADGTVKEWDMEKYQLIQTIPANEGWTRSVAYNYNATLIASGGDDGKIEIWNAADGQNQNSIIGHSNWVQTIEFSPDGRYVASGGHDNILTLIDTENGSIVYNSPPQDYFVLCVAFEPTGKHFVSTSLYSEKLNVWDISALNISNKSNDVELPKTKALIAWNSANNTSTENLSFQVNANIKSDSEVSSVDVYINGKKFSTERNLYGQTPSSNFDHNFQKIVYLNSGSNEIKLVAYNYGGQSESQLLNVTFVEPKKEEVIVQTQPKPAVVAAPVVAAVADAAISSDELVQGLSKNKSNPYRYALIFGNEDYSSYQTGLESESNVDFAENDARAFREFAINILGVPEDNVMMKINARAIEMDDLVSKLGPITKALNGKAEIIFYYAGHGFPDEQTKEPHLIPVDVSGTNLKFAVKLKDLYATLSQHPSSKITVYLDACFSGGARESGLVAARGVKIKPKEEQLGGNLVVMSASSGSESALPYKSKKHGMFTYFLLQKLKETNGDLSYRELSEYVAEQVGVKSVLINSKSQSPQTNTSSGIQDTWGDWTIR
ncbi:MAG: caspase family protein [Reichenbachiella sp.]